MYSRSPSSRIESMLAALCVGALACNLAGGQPGQAATATATNETAPVADATDPPPSEAAASTATESPTATSTVGPPPVVTVSAVGGRLNVRRGPGPEYDTVGAFLDGQSSTATSRNQAGDWVLISVPNRPSVQGWIIMTTKYTAAKGDVMGLPVAEVEAAVPAYIRNCTPHEMLINPTGVIVLGRGNSPDNQQRFFPGEYTVIDQSTEVEVGGVTVFEGKTIDIKKDSGGTSYKCP